MPGALKQSGTASGTVLSRAFLQKGAPTPRSNPAQMLRHGSAARLFTVRNQPMPKLRCEARPATNANKATGHCLCCRNTSPPASSSDSGSAAPTTGPCPLPRPYREELNRTQRVADHVANNPPTPLATCQLTCFQLRLVQRGHPQLVLVHADAKARPLRRLRARHEVALAKPVAVEIHVVVLAALREFGAV